MNLKNTTLTFHVFCWGEGFNITTSTIGYEYLTNFRRNLYFLSALTRWEITQGFGFGEFFCIHGIIEVDFVGSIAACCCSDDMWK